jgi:heat-inducible transcriptional repressor
MSSYSRKYQILKYIVEYFIKTAQPVGSKTLIDEYHLEYSSATIRNDMALLEEEGLIEKTHTSSGRVPSNKGYHFYIDNLRKKNVDEDVKYQLANIFTQREKSIDDVIKESCEILSHMTNLASVVLGPSANDEHLLSVAMYPLSANSVTAVFITDKGYVENKTFVVNEEMNMKDLEECVKILNDRLKGASISDLIERMETIKPIISEYVKNNDVLYRAIADALIKFTSGRVSMFGQSNLLNQPEFNSDTEKLKELIKLIEHPDEVASALSKSKEGTDVYIGKENQKLDDVSVVTSDINIRGKQLGKIALVGPTRMDYDKVISALEYVVDKLKEIYGEPDGKEEGNDKGRE